MLSCVSPHILFLVKKLFSSFERMDGLVQRNLATPLARVRRRDQRERAEVNRQIRYERINIDSDVLSYVADDAERIGVFVAAQPLSPDHNYFEIELLDPGEMGSVTLGLVPQHCPLDKQPGQMVDSVGYRADDGRLYKRRLRGTIFGPKCEAGDKMGCGVLFEEMSAQDYLRPLVPVFFTKNGKEVGSVLMHWPAEGLFPAVSMQSAGEEVKLTLDIKWTNEDDMLMSIDSHEDDWSRLHDIRLNGQILEYIGRGKSIVDVGLAQARCPLNTTCHYYEIEIIDPGENCYIAIGLARRNYPKHRHPGWNKGSIAYHADDGKLFIGSGIGDPFGPKCHKGDIMGCGIIFPRDYVCNYDSDGSHDMSPASPNDVDDLLELDDYEGSQSDSDGEDLWGGLHNGVENGAKVQVFFTRNGKTIGRKDICIPKGGFYPTVGMLSSDEKVKVDLRPLSG